MQLEAGGRSHEPVQQTSQSVGSCRGGLDCRLDAEVGPHDQEVLAVQQPQHQHLVGGREGATQNKENEKTCLTVRAYYFFTSSGK